MSSSFHSFRKKSGLVLLFPPDVCGFYLCFLLFILAASRIFSLILRFHHYEFDDSRQVCGHIFSFLMSVHLEVELLDSM